jgi:hypothetical protein
VLAERAGMVVAYALLALMYVLAIVSASRARQLLRYPT